MHSYSVLSEADCQTSAQPWLLFVCASSYANAKPLCSELCCNLHSTFTTKKKMSVQTSAFPQSFLSFPQTAASLDLLCVRKTKALSIYLLSTTLVSSQKHGRIQLHGDWGPDTAPLLFQITPVRYKEVQGRLCYVCVCARSDQWAMQWHQQAQWDRDGEILILVDLYENLDTQDKTSSKMFKLIHNRVAKRWKISSKFWKHSRNFGNFPGFFWNLPGIYGKFPPLCNPNI